MSGGHFDYNCFRISQFADELKVEIEDNHTEDEDWGYAPHYADETIELLEVSHNIIEMAGKIAKEVEWLYSGDTGEEDFVKWIRGLMKYGDVIKRTEE